MEASHLHDYSIMKEVLIINAGGFGRSIASTAIKDLAYQKEWVIKGFLDSRSNLPASKSSLLIVGDPLTYQYKSPQIIVCALGDPSLRRKYSQHLWDQGADFMNLMPNLHRAEGVEMGQGCIFEHNVSLGANAKLGNFVLVLAMSIIGYDVSLGSFSTIESFVSIGGGASIGENVVIHPHTTILPGVKVGKNSVIGAGSVVISDVPENMTYYGNPAKPLRF